MHGVPSAMAVLHSMFGSNIIKINSGGIEQPPDSPGPGFSFNSRDTDTDKTQARLASRNQICLDESLCT